MNKLLTAVFRFGTFCSAVFFIGIFMLVGFTSANQSLFAQDTEAQDQNQYPFPNQYPSQSQYKKQYQDQSDQQNLNPGQQMEQNIQKQQAKTYRSYSQDENLYYKVAAPKNSQNPDYFRKDHPLQEKPLQEHLLR